MSLLRSLPALAVALAATPALAQSDISPVNKYSWSENCGWMNWRDAGSPTGASGARLALNVRVLAGLVWCENVGWINLGNGAPANGFAYANAAGEDFGVNVNPATGSLSGYAWGENVGWINFDAGAAKGAAYAARISTDSPRRFFGYLWGENVGWINLDDPSRFVGFATCPADFNQSGIVSVQDIFDFLAAYFGADSRADFNNSGVISVQDIFDFLAAYFTGC